MRVELLLHHGQECEQPTPFSDECGARGGSFFMSHVDHRSLESRKPAKSLCGVPPFSKIYQAFIDAIAQR
jgi:hypothetical protein